MKSSMKVNTQEEQKKPKGGVKFTDVDEIKTIPSNPKKAIAEVEHIKPVNKLNENLTDDAYLKSLKNKLNFDDMLAFNFYEDTMLIRLSDFEKGLKTMLNEFPIYESDVIRICGIAKDKCKCTNPTFDDNVM